MLIQCTKKLLDVLKLNPTEGAEEIPLFSWHANLITINRRKTVVLMNNKNRYVVVLYGLKSKDFKNLDNLIIKAIKATFLEEGINPDIVERFISQSPNIVYTKTKNRTTTGWLNKACDNTYFASRVLEVPDVYNNTLGAVASSLWVGSVYEDSLQPDEMMINSLESFGVIPLRKYKALELSVYLGLTNHKVYRKIIVPSNITFLQLHKIMQVAFEWKNYHLNDFMIFDGEKPVANLVTYEEDMEYPVEGVEMKLYNGVKLSEYVPEYKRILYVYDYGDNWEHYIEVTDIIDNYSGISPVCIEGDGSAPPEDVGGDYGYDEFLKIITDPSHEDYESMKQWGKGQGYKDFDIESVNRRLKNCLKW